MSCVGDSADRRRAGRVVSWHSHAGPAVVNVTWGELVYVDGDESVQRPYRAGTAFVDAGRGHTRTAFNATNEETVFVATFYEAPEQGPLLITAPSACGLQHLIQQPPPPARAACPSRPLRCASRCRARALADVVACQSPTVRW